MIGGWAILFKQPPLLCVPTGSYRPRTVEPMPNSEQSSTTPNSAGSSPGDETPFFLAAPKMDIFRLIPAKPMFVFLLTSCVAKQGRSPHPNPSIQWPRSLPENGLSFRVQSLSLQGPRSRILRGGFFGKTRLRQLHRCVCPATQTSF